MEMQQFKEISKSVYSNIQALSPKDLETIRNILQLKTIKYGRIRTFSLEDSQRIILLTLKQNCLILIKFLLENGIEIPGDTLDAVIELLFSHDEPESAWPQQEAAKPQVDIDLTAQIEKERTENQIFQTIVDIVYLSGYSNTKLKEFLAAKSVPDDASVNFAPIVDCEYRSFELTVLNKTIVGPVLHSILKSYRRKLRKVVKRHIICNVGPMLDGVNNGAIYQIYYLINEDEDNELLENVKAEHTPEYLGFVSSLIKGKASAEIAYKKLVSFFDDLEYAFSVLISSSKQEGKKIHPNDELLMERALECIMKLTTYKPVSFYRFISGIQAVLRLPVSGRMKGLIYEILSKYMFDKDIFVERIVDCKEEIKEELRTKEFFLLPAVIRFINSYQRRVETEMALAAQGRSRGSLYATGGKEAGPGAEIAQDSADYRVFGLRSEDPETVIECFDMPISFEIIKLTLSHVRNAIIRDTRVSDKIIAYQIANGTPISDTLIISALTAAPSDNFFKYARLFSDFSAHLNGDVLEHISDNLEEGLEWLYDAYTPEMGRFILRNCGFFNDLLSSNRSSQSKFLRVYSRVLKDNLDTAKVILRKEDSDELDTFLVFGDDSDACDEFFKIFATQLLYSHFFRPDMKDRFVLQCRLCCPGYVLYVKSKAVTGMDVVSDVNFLKSSIYDTDELVGYLKVVSDAPLAFESSGSENISPRAAVLLNFGLQSSSHFLKYFKDASDLEKFILFFSIDTVNAEIEKIIKDETMKHLRSTNKVYLAMCVLQLFKCRNIGAVLQMLENYYDDKEVLFRLGLYNVLTGGQYCSKSLITQVSADLMCKGLFIINHYGIWDRDYLMELISRVEDRLNDEQKRLINAIREGRSIGV